jgi:signal transduction histidine kinase
MLERIFGPFTNLDYSRARPHVGLAHAQYLVLLNGGSVCTHSEGGGLGSVLCVRLPVSPRTLPTTTRLWKPAGGELPPAGAFNGVFSSL